MTLMPSEGAVTQTVEPNPGSAKWWLGRLEAELNNRKPDMDDFRKLVDDDHPEIDSIESARKFRRMSGLATTNLTGLAVEATAERITLEGVRVGGEPDADKGVWDMLQRCDFDAGSQEATTAALVYSRSFISVAPPKGDGEPRLHFEDPRQVVMAYTPDGERAAALKVFTDEWTGETFGTLYMPNLIVKMVRKGDPTKGPVKWLARPLPTNQAAVVANPLGEVPFFELQNKLTGAIRSEVAPLIIPQMLLNQTMFNIEAISEYGAFRQKWVTGIQVPRDPTTNAPISPFEANVAKLLVSEGDNTRFGDFNATDLKPHIELAQEIAAHMARLSRVPITYFLSNVSNLSAEALALLISGLVKKCERRVKGYEPAIEGAVRLALRSKGDARAGVANIEAKWAEMETSSRAQDADAAVKLTQGENPVLTPQTVQERYLGMSQTERDRDDAWRRRQRGGTAIDLITAAAKRVTNGNAEPTAEG